MPRYRQTGSWTSTAGTRSGRRCRGGRRLIHLRSREPTLQSGAQRLVGAAPDLFCFERQLGQRFLVALNFSSRRVPLALTDDARGPAVLELSTRPEREHGPVDLTNLVLEPDEGMILRRSVGGQEAVARSGSLCPERPWCVPRARTAPSGQDVCWGCLPELIRACAFAARTASASVSMS